MPDESSRSKRPREESDGLGAAEGSRDVVDVDAEDPQRLQSVVSVGSSGTQKLSAEEPDATGSPQISAQPLSPSHCPTDVVCPGESELSPSKSVPEAASTSDGVSTVPVGPRAILKPSSKKQAASASYGNDSPPPRPTSATVTPSVPATVTQTTQQLPPSNSNLPTKRELKQRTLDKYQPPPPIDVILRKELEDKNLRVDQLQHSIAVLEAEVGNGKFLQQEYEKRISELEARDAKAREVLCSVMQDMARSRRREARRQQHSQHFELGHIITAPSTSSTSFGASMKEMWVEGNRTREILRKQEELAAREVELEQERANLQARLATLRRQGGTAAAITGSLLRPADEISNGLSAITDEAIEIEERLVGLRREQEVTMAARDSLLAETTALDAEKRVFLKEIRRISEEDASEFATRSVIGKGRYVLIELLGKGGFSEVWKAFDLKDMLYVACKIHKVGREMSPQQKHHYLRHAERELEIMRTLNHARLTRLLDVFEPENTNDTFVAVMEYCAGTDLDTFLKSRGCLKEPDAKTIMLQIISALRHMADAPRPVIHYDLKPANVLFCRASPLCLDIKIADFGLSKIMTNAQESAMNSKHAEGIELTSQGTGTYWYLPPECFDTTRTPTINGKVDIWAAGVMFYQMLYGRRPFAEGVSQRQIWQDKLITQLAAKPLEFPALASGKVSDEAKAVILRCLAPNVHERCDIYQLSADPYFRKIPRAKAVAKGAAPSAQDTMPPPS